MAETYEMVAGKPTIRKDPDEVLDYSIDWSAYLAVEGDTIQTSNWTVSAGLTRVSQSYTTTASAVFVSGGTAGSTETATCRITTTGGRTVDRTVYLKIEDR